MTWDNPEELEAYIQKLQGAADRLTSENRRLRKSHATVCDKVRTFCRQGYVKLNADVPAFWMWSNLIELMYPL